MPPGKLIDNHARRLPDFLTVGRILRPHGIRGGVLVEANSELIHEMSPGVTVLIGDSRDETVLKSIRPHRGQFILYFEGITNRDRVETLRDTELAISLQDSSPLPEGTYFHWQILGMQVETEDGEHLGKIVNILETGANDVYIISSGDSEFLIPATEEVVLKVDLEKNRMTVHLLSGLLD
jgi:16S rRNA processing protein RimM